MKSFPIGGKGSSKHAPDNYTGSLLQNSPATAAHVAKVQSKLFGGSKPSNPNFTQKDTHSATAAQTPGSLAVARTTFAKPKMGAC